MANLKIPKNIYDKNLYHGAVAGVYEYGMAQYVRVNKNMSVQNLFTQHLSTAKKMNYSKLINCIFVLVFPGEYCCC